nr:hypothetical protein HmN_000439400 [Hymenolepis microstoma]
MDKAGKVKKCGGTSCQAHFGVGTRKNKLFVRQYDDLQHNHPVHMTTAIDHQIFSPSNFLNIPDYDAFLVTVQDFTPEFP